jgi:hypothetical protein
MKFKYLFGIALFISYTCASASWYAGIGYGETDYDADAISTFDDPIGIEFYIGNKFSENLGFLGIR